MPAYYLGLLFVVFGSNAFLHFLPMPPMPGHPGEFIGAMNATGYLQAVAAFQVTGGLLLIVGRFVPLGLTLLGPIVVNILFFHIFLDRTGMPMALCVCAIFLFCGLAISKLVHSSPARQWTRNE